MSIRHSAITLATTTVVLAAGAAVVVPASATAAEPGATGAITTRSAPTSINDCRFNMKWQQKTMRGKCGSKKFKVKGNGYSYTRLKGKVYNKTFNVRFSDTGGLSGRVGGTKIRNVAGEGLGPNRTSSISGNTKVISAEFGVGKGKRARLIHCDAVGTVTGPASIRWSSQSFTSQRWSGNYNTKILKGKSPMWGACAVLVGSAAVFLGT
jgi:hypothetical protein